MRESIHAESFGEVGEVGEKAEARATMNVAMTLAINDSDHVRDIVSGRVSIAGIDLTCLLYPVEEIFFRFTKYREWEVSEMSFGKFCALQSRDDDSLVGIPVFPSRSFRHSGFFIRADGPVDDPAALAGGRIGIPEWTVTATIYQRGLLQHEFNVPLNGIDWVQGGLNEPGRIETLPVETPAGISVRTERDRSLNEMLLGGDLDAICAPRPPAAFVDRSGKVIQLFSDSQGIEQEYYQRTGIFPIMHVLVLRRDVYERYPWAAVSLLAAFTEAKERSLTRLSDLTAPHFPLPWVSDRARAAEEIFGVDLWPYGVDANRVTIEAFLSYAREQGITRRHVTVDELFPESVTKAHVV